jgi:hypothetical protein
MSTWLKTSVASFALAVCLSGTTLQQLSLDEMARKSTGVVVGKVTATHIATRGTSIYTFYTVQVIEQWKGGAATQLDIAVAGGSAGAKRQVVSGAPALSVGQEYVLYYWTGPSGLTQLLGLSQGLFSVVADGTANPVLVRPAAAETMLDKNGNVVQDQALSLRLADLRNGVKNAIQKAAN